MRLLFALIFTLLTLPAKADQSCVPYLECQPLTTKAVRGPLATHLFWFVRNAETGGIDHHGFSCQQDKCDLQLLIKTANEVLTGQKTPAAAWGDSMTFGCDYNRWQPYAGQNEICAERKQALLTMRDVWLAGIPRQIVLWRVKANGLEATRPIRALVNGALEARTIGRATVGAPCIVNGTFLQSGADRWMPYWANNDRPVVLCERVQP